MLIIYEIPTIRGSIYTVVKPGYRLVYITHAINLNDVHIHTISLNHDTEGALLKALVETDGEVHRVNQYRFFVDSLISTNQQ